MRIKTCAAFSLTEGAIVMGVVGLILSGLWTIVSDVNEKSNRRQLTSQITMIVQNYRDRYAKTSSTLPSGGDEAVMDKIVRDNVIPAEMLRDRSAAKLKADHPWGATGASGSLLSRGGVVVEPSGTFVGQDYFTVSVFGLKYSSCMGMISSVQAEGPGELAWMMINGGSLLSLPISAEDAASDCEKEPADEANELNFIYRIRGRRKNLG